jgi:low affinity Fe/Cu permease
MEAIIMTTEQEQNQSSRRARGRDALSTVIWAFIFIWAGGVLLAENLGYLGPLQARLSDTPGAWSSFGLVSWPLIFLGAGVLLLAEAGIRAVVPTFRRAILGRLILATIFIGVGLGPLTNWGLIWPVILILVGASMLLRGFFRNR